MFISATAFPTSPRKNADGETIGMDHTLFMAKTQATIDAGLGAASGVPLAEALHSIRVRMMALFGGIPLTLVDATVSMAF